MFRFDLFHAVCIAQLLICFDAGNTHCMDASLSGAVLNCRAVS